MALEQTASDADIRALYRTVLKREAESDAVVRNYTDAQVTLGAALETFLNCPEYVERNVPSGSAAIWTARQPGIIEVAGTEEQLAAMRAHVEKVWSAYGEKETYWSVLTADKYRDKAMDAAALADFYASGYRTYEQIARLLSRNGIADGRIQSVLDFGCGVGRLAAPFVEHFGRYTGVDISPGHLRLARERAAESALVDTDFMTVADFLRSDIAYDLYYSLIVLQHNPPPIMREMLRAGLQRVRAGGYALFQVPATIFDYSFSVERYLAGGARDSMEMHALPQRAVFADLADAGFQLLEAVPDPFIGTAGISYVYLAEKKASLSPTTCP